MKPLDIISFAFNNIKQKKTQSMLTMMGIVIGIFAIVSLVSIGYGVEEYMHGEMMKMGGNKLTILPIKQFGIPPTHFFTDKDIKAIHNIRGVDSVVYGWYGGTDIEYNNEKKYVGYFYGAPNNIKKVYSETGYNIEEGRWLSNSDTYKCNIGYGVAHSLFNKNVKIGDRIIVKDKKFKVVGIMGQVGNQQDDNIIMIPISVGENIFDKKNEYNFITVVVKDGADMAKISNEISNKLEKSFGDTEFSVLSAEQLAETIGGVLSVLTLFISGVAGISLLVGAVGISNTTHMSILQRKKDIGILKSLGAETTDILAIFIVESGFLGLFGGIVGIIFGIIAAKIIENIAHASGYLMVNAWISWELIVGVLIFSFMMGVISGYLPARSGAKLNPIDTLRGE
ncbi:protein of unknown function DUF214 [Methanococcus aeolicus Nankai-3]|uniref:ABC3 transporter permease protein domain-containing protein n=1 Tax=Methanococcus aeolicus (strain ATCC BAA-1280 / DSM 17508 / OCM 812 / Nankai-3) TaxID=419665 RepID=A6UWP0_META3|nr:ABC transporter permease [Methanococcus aeolicus]ABR56912.1 protein of unknown function DUF214 [Methanococcus aeolicus Nankai-3]